MAPEYCQVWPQNVLPNFLPLTTWLDLREISQTETEISQDLIYMQALKQHKNKNPSSFKISHEDGMYAWWKPVNSPYSQSESG